jgi:hypothetical protein
MEQQLIDIPQYHPLTETIYSISFNQDYSCFSIGTEIGFRIYSTFPFKNVSYKQFEGGIQIVEMLNRTNILALVGSGANPLYMPNKIILWDDNLNKIITELRFVVPVNNIKLKNDK